MAEGILFIEGFEKDDNFSVWEDISSGYPVQRTTGTKRSGNYGMRPSGALGNGVGQSPLFRPCTEIILGFAFKPVAIELGSLPNPLHIAQLLQAPGNFMVGLEFTQQRTFGVSGAGPYGYTERMVELDTWYYLEWYVKIHPSLGETILRINGNVEFTATSINTGTPTWGGINQFFMGHIGGGNTGTELWYDDIYVRDASIGGFLGDVEVIGVELVDDYTIQWIRNSLTKNYLTQIENTPDEDVTYVSTDIAAKDLYEVEDSTFGGVIHAVQLVSRGRKTSTELWRLNNIVHVGGLELEGPDHYMAYPLYETYPPDVFGHQPNGSDWTLPAFNAMKVGFYAEPVT